MYSLYTSSTLTKYLNSLYTTVLILAGGDVHPVTLDETMFASFGVFMSAIINA